MPLTLILQENDYSYIGTIILGILLSGVVFLIFLFIRKIITTILDGLEMGYALFTKRPIFIHFYLFKRKLNRYQIHILKAQFSFYNRLNEKHQTYFRHRVATFIKRKKFIGKEGFVVTEEAKVLISATAIMLTFGFRNYIIEYIKTIIIYPTAYYSRFSKASHKGEFNPRLKTLVLSWDNFIEGHRIKNDKLNLGIHEFAHAIHFNSIKQEDINAILFVDTFNELRTMLSSNEQLKRDLVASEFIRSYAFTNDSELLAVIIETFIESPKTFKKLFPEIYGKVKQMLNFNFSGY
ncbi:zinc-dependent peptidase [Algibacter sp. 2305UL17-15]|uniref:zinc-dependent peptidase n=1 Tax=Algibacter sp. 2305UL17-15 TaxID=3231268 RepID=UPI0034593D4A